MEFDFKNNVRGGRRSRWCRLNALTLEIEYGARSFLPRSLGHHVVVDLLRYLTYAGPDHQLVRFTTPSSERTLQ